jgi:F-type H+-transporting ATPase subunit gamma
MSTIVELRRRIDTATDLGSVVRTMKTLAAVNIHQYETAVQALAHYSHTIELGFQVLLRHDQFRPDKVDAHTATGAVVFGTDQGMCGQFNEQIVSLARQRQQSENTGPPWLSIVVGSRAEEQFMEVGLSVDHTYQVPTSASDITNLVLELLPHIERWRTENSVTRLLVFHNRRVTASSYSPHWLQMLPIDKQRLQQWREEPWNSSSLPAYVTDRRRLLSRLIRQYLFVSLFRACAESLASENASRIAAMQSAEKNINDQIDDLRRLFNHIRQTAITEELLDVVTGFEALSQKSAR